MGLMSSLSKVVRAVVKPVGDLVGDTLNRATGVSQQLETTYEQQKAAQEAQNAYNLYMWNLQNDYNTPAAQLARMKEAGVDFNPTAYALGSSNLSNTASSVTSANGFSGSGSPAGNPISSLMGVAQGIQGLKNARADYNLKQQTEDRTALETDILRHNLKYGQDHGLPVGSVPGTDATLASILTAGPKKLYNTLTSKSDSNYFRKASEWLGDKVYQWTH